MNRWPRHPRPALLLVVAVGLVGACRNGDGTHKGGEGSGADSASGGDDTATSGGDESFSLLEAGRLNHLLPQYVALDAEARRLYLSSNAFRSLAVVDIDAGTLLDVISLPDSAQPRTGIRVDSAGVVWVSAGSSPSLSRYDPATGVVEPVDSGQSAVVALARRPDGGVVSFGASLVEGETSTVVIDPDGSVVHEEAVILPTFGFTETTRGQVAVLEAQGSHLPSVLRLLDPTDLSEQSRLSAESLVEHPGTFGHLADLGEGRFAELWDDTVMVIDSDTNHWVVLLEGTENKSMLPIPEGLLVFDRLSSDPETAPVHGEARGYDLELNPIGDPWPTGKNTGYVAYDPLTGLAWVNSEGSSEVLAIDPLTGELRSRVRTGEHVESITTAEDGDVVWFTGRLTNTVGRIDRSTGTVTLNDQDLIWPVAPAWLDGQLFVLTQMTNELVRLDPDSLAVLSVSPLDLSLNGTLTFDDLHADEARGSLFLTQTVDHVLLEVEAATGLERARWSLSGPPPEDENKPGHYQIMPVGDHLVVLCTSSGLGSVINPDSEDVVALPLSLSQSDSLSRATRFEHLSPVVGAGLFYVDGFAFDALSFEAVPAFDVEVDVIIGELHGQRLAYVEAGGAAGEGGGELRLLDEEGRVVAYRALGLGVDAAPTFFVKDGEVPRLFVTDFETASVYVLDLSDMATGG